MPWWIFAGKVFGFVAADSSVQTVKSYREVVHLFIPEIQVKNRLYTKQLISLVTGLLCTANEQ